MFDRIAPRYDQLNRILSCRRDVAWRRRLARRLEGQGALRVLDLATGTGDQLIAIDDAGVELSEAIGMDMSVEMLNQGRKKLDKLGRAGTIQLEEGDATAIPAEANRFDAVTISFGIRNVLDVDGSLRDMLRVLRPGGQVLILEFSLPSSSFLRRLYLGYLRQVLPRIGGALSGDAAAYRYLNETVETFPHGEGFLDLMRQAGFSSVQAFPQTLGVATLYEGYKPES